MVFPGGVLQEEDTSVTESSSSSWQWPWAASGEINMWNPLRGAMADVFAGWMHLPHVFLPQVLSLDVLIPVNEVRKAC